MHTTSKTLKLVLLVVGLVAATTFVTTGFASDRGKPVSLPDRVLRAPELGAVLWSGANNAFAQIQFDRGRITAVDASARMLTIQQQQAGRQWRVQSFSIPSGADIFAAGQAEQLSNLRVGTYARIEQTALPGAALEVVRVDAATRGELSLPPTTAAGPPLAGGTAAGGSEAKGDGRHPRFLPARFSNAPEIRAVVFSRSSNGFIERQFDRGKVTALSAASAGGTGSITILQRQAGHVWRTQTFAIPTNVAVVHEGTAAAPAKLRVGMRVRIEQSGPVGGSLTVVRIDSNRGNREVDFPTSSG